MFRQTFWVINGPNILNNTLRAILILPAAGDLVGAAASVCVAITARTLQPYDVVRAVACYTTFFCEWKEGGGDIA